MNKAKIKSHVTIGKSVELSIGVDVGVGCIIDDSVFVGENTKIEDEVFIGAGTTIESDCYIETGVKIGKNVTIKKGCRVGEEAIIDDNVILNDTFYIKTSKSNLTYCGNNKVSIGCQIFSVDFWLKNYSKVAEKFDYTEQEIQECLKHMTHIKNNI